MDRFRNAALEALDQRRSTPVAGLRAPGPDPSQLRRMLQSAIRVPDHGRLVPWRIVEVAENDRSTLASALAARHRAADPDISEARLSRDIERFGNSPMLLVVIARIDAEHKVPVQEQVLSAGCVCFALLQAAQALGFSGQWLTGWAAYDEGAARILHLSGAERVIGFIHLGTATHESPERHRPLPEDVLSRWQP